ncbi:unnamed protein product [Oncorhynchus mykiss]|uniref:Uncharacterized protein n=1 Tax=Oncorhynchus mykiss TaxID=8022 RepID=A0A060YP55_ONCMY|nr:unnamed protein product [Oncorhynchus mykiss]
MSTLTRKDSGDSKSNRTRAGSTGSNSSGKRASESKLKEPVFNTGMRRVTHCKVTVQIYLSRPSKRIGTAEAPKPSVAAVSGRSSAPHTAPDSKNAPDRSVRSTGVRKTPTFTIPLKKSVSHTPLDTPNYRSPVKSPSQYFQICY